MYRRKTTPRPTVHGVIYSFPLPTGGHSYRARGKRTPSCPRHADPLSAEAPQAHGARQKTNATQAAQPSRCRSGGGWGWSFRIAPDRSSSGEGEGGGGCARARACERNKPQLGCGADEGSVRLPQEPNQRGQHAARGRAFCPHTLLLLVYLQHKAVYVRTLLVNSWTYQLSITPTYNFRGLLPVWIT